MNEELLNILKVKKTKLSGNEAVALGKMLSETMERNKNKKSFTIKKLAEDIGILDVRFIERLVRLGNWPRKVHTYIISNEKIEFPVLREFLDYSWSQADPLILAIQRKLDDNKPRKKRSPRIFTEFDKVRLAHLRTLNLAEKLRTENKELKQDLKSISEKELTDQLQKENRLLKETVKSLLEGRGRISSSSPQEPPVSSDQMYIIQTLISRYGIRVRMNYQKFELHLDCLSAGAFEKVIERLINV